MRQDLLPAQQWALEPDFHHVKGHLRGLHLRSHQSSVSTACSNSLFSPSSCRTNREEEALNSHITTITPAFGAQAGRGSIQSQWGSRHRSEGVVRKGSGQATPSCFGEFPSFTWGLLFLWFYSNWAPILDCLKYLCNPSPRIKSHCSDRGGFAINLIVYKDGLPEWSGPKGVYSQTWQAVLSWT